MKIAAVCLTYNRPALLGELIESFLRQDHLDKELIVLDDADQYQGRQGENWRIVSVRERFPSVADKRNAANSLVSPDVEGIAVWDDDDLYLPWALSACAAGLASRPWVQPTEVLHWTDREHTAFSRHRTYRKRLPRSRFYRGSWAYHKAAFGWAGGYKLRGIGEDCMLRDDMLRMFGMAADPIALGFRPYYVYNTGTDTYHLSTMGTGNRGYEALGRWPVNRHPDPRIGWPRDYAAIPIPDEVQPFPWEERRT